MKTVLFLIIIKRTFKWVIIWVPNDGDIFLKPQRTLCPHLYLINSTLRIFGHHVFQQKHRRIEHEQLENRRQ